NETIHLIVLILSSRSNFNARKVLRESWVKSVDYLGVTIKSYFVLGNSDCQVPKDYLEDKFGCSSLVHNETEDLKTNISSHLQVSINSPERLIIFNGFSFKVHHDLLLKRIGCLASCTCDNIILTNVITQEILYNQSFGSVSGQFHGYNYQDASPILLLPKGFIGLLIATGKDDSNCQPKQINYWNQFTKLTQTLRVYNDLNDFESKKFNGNDQVKTSFVVELSDQDEYRKIIRDAKKVHTNHINQLNLIESKLQDEINQFNDIILVDNVDIYRNLPRKLVNAISWIVSSSSSSLQFADFILKTDDDCFIDLEKVTSKIKLLTSRESIWWGNFRRNNLINIYGKWSENDFPGSVYPSFACGSGYVISIDIAKWINSNKDYLHYYQGEDVSMGIWLSSILPTYFMDSDWACAEDSPRDGLLALCQLNSSQLLQFNKIKSSEKHQRLLTV
ncbi:UDP-GalNAc:beta-1,3-N-acetylgalactosaminyltransferase 2-like, partial [Panonychus citri]|uniref:UDP-GalNAc:beta-1, 3-N-acetylgalactosaminyltransferase 2-like n=1 Tax=Panonychus citri TaxID=50023 RepID=UPI002307FA4A